MTLIPETPDNESLAGGMSIIVVSDLHLGLSGGDTVSETFCSFLDFVKTLRPEGAAEDVPSLLADGNVRPLYAPDRIILLGDIVDLWSPRHNNRANVLSDSLLPIRKLGDLPCRKIYVTGNHDNEINEVAGLFPRKNSPEITIIDRHYPEGKELDGREKFAGLPAGKHRYHFLHGQQFDIMFICATFLRDYPGWVANNSEVFREHPRLKWAIRVLLLLTSIYLIANFFGIVMPGVWNAALHILFGISLVIFIFSLDTGKFREYWDIATQKTPAKWQTIWAIVKYGFWKIDEGKDITADIVVFGHTHLADDSRRLFCNDPVIGKRFINTGAWSYNENDNPRGSYTFVYIDKDGPLLCRWIRDSDTSGHPEYISTPPTLDPTIVASLESNAKRIPGRIQIWFRKHLSMRG